jgi:hypothetical protein
MSGMCAVPPGTPCMASTRTSVNGTKPARKRMGDGNEAGIAKASQGAGHAGRARKRERGAPKDAP